MANTSKNPDTYLPGNAPSSDNEDIKNLAKWAHDEFLKIASQFTEISLVKLQVLHVEPVRPRDGMVAYADGTHWDPGSGEGPYAFIGGVWTQLFP